MAYSFRVLVARKSLPSAAELSSVLARGKLPLTFPEPWSWDDQSGWLPMLWRKDESGCEIEVERLTTEEVTAASNAGYTGLDSAVIITVRGDESHKAGVAFAGAVAAACSGCITEDEGEYVSSADAIKWAKKAVAVADKRARLEQQNEEIRARVRAAGNVEGTLAAALSEMAGMEVASLVLVMNQLGVALKGGERISGSAWRVTGRDGRRYEQDRYATLRSRQFELMSIAGAEMGPAEEKELQRLEQQLQEAEALDEQGRLAAMQEIESWPKKLAIDSVSWSRPNLISVHLDCGAVVDFVGGVFGAVACVIPPLSYDISSEGAKLSGE